MTARQQHQVYGYTVDGIFYASKIHALVAAGGDLSKIKLYFCNDEWRHVDWTKEPKQSIKQLVDIRCRQIRDSYKHVSLFYSSGYDSHTILNSFIRNNLVLDQVIVWDRSWVQEYLKPEIDHALTVARQLKKNIWPRLNIVYWKMDPKDVEKFYIKHKHKWMEIAGDHLAAQKSIRNFQFENAKEILGLHDQKDHIVIEGRDKPRLDLRNGKWYAMMNDKLLKFSFNNNAEQFYYSPHFPELYVKQCHSAIAWLEKNFYDSHTLIHDFQSFNVTPNIYKRYNIEALERDPVPEHTGGAGGLNKYVDANGVLSVESQKCQILLSEEVLKIYQKGVEEIKSAFGRAWDGKKNSLGGVISEQYYLRDYKAPESVTPC